MSVEVITRVFCDECGYPAPGCFGTSVNGHEAREAAKGDGWTIGQGRNSKDLCPICTEEAEAS